MAVLDDVSKSLHGVKEGADQNLKGKLRDACGRNEYFDDCGIGFKIHHYAGKKTVFDVVRIHELCILCICICVLTMINYFIGVVEYNVDGFVERNKDVFNNDLIELMQTSTNNLIQKLFPDVIDRDNKKRPPTAGSKIKRQVIKSNNNSVK